MGFSGGEGIQAPFQERPGRELGGAGPPKDGTELRGPDALTLSSVHPVAAGRRPLDPGSLERGQDSSSWTLR